ncbi:cohesin domain-containing protein [Methanolobus bombayensis]|uniref:cohesin domain-containing protein n=1 Tax=Methanolobus bombayensis TaxID=38023 RepID=UPI001AEA2CB2|nr:hypothetical protein [Methanolobus bombayensis]
MITITYIKSCKSFSAISIFVLITLLLAGTANAEISVAFYPSQTSVEENEEFTIDIMIESDVNVSGAEMQLTYDPELIEVTSISEGNFFKQDGESTIFSKGTIDNELGTVNEIYSVIMGDDTMLEPDIFATITLHSKEKSGVAILEMKNVIITNSAGDSLETKITNAEIIVGDVEVTTPESGAETETEEESVTTGQNSSIIALIALCCLYIVRKRID